MERCKTLFSVIVGINDAIKSVTNWAFLFHSKSVSSKSDLFSKLHQIYLNRLRSSLDGLRNCTLAASLL
jgi:hypothetical protein